MMDPLVEIESTRSLAGALGHTNWGWEIPVYLFLGGLVAGLLLAVCAVALLRGRARVTEAMRRGLLATPALLSLGMVALFVDLSYKLHVLRFYTAFRPYAPMSWGSWILLAVYPVMALLVLALPPAFLVGPIARGPLLQRLSDWSAAHLRGLALGGHRRRRALGVYTGVLLSATGAQPLWSSGALGALFLASGASAGVAALMLVERDHESQPCSRAPTSAHRRRARRGGPLARGAALPGPRLPRGRGAHPLGLLRAGLRGLRALRRAPRCRPRSRCSRSAAAPRTSARRARARAPGGHASSASWSCRPVRPSPSFAREAVMETVIDPSHDAEAPAPRRIGTPTSPAWPWGRCSSGPSSSSAAASARRAP